MKIKDSQWVRWLLGRLSVGALAVLVITFALLQYHWLSELSERDRESRLQRLSADAKHFSFMFDEELSRAFRAFELSAAIGEQDEANDLATRYDAWRAQSAFPGIIKELWILSATNDRSESGSDGEASLGQRAARRGATPVPVVRQAGDVGTWVWQTRKFDPATGSLLSEALPARLQGVQGLFNGYAVPQVIDEARSPPLELEAGHAGINESIMAILTPPIPRPSEFRTIEAPSNLTAEASHRGGGATGLGIVVVVLDKAYIVERVLPELTERYFSKPPGRQNGRSTEETTELEYDVSVRSANKKREVIFDSSRAGNAMSTVPDVTEPMLGLRLSTGGTSAGLTPRIVPSLRAAPTSHAGSGPFSVSGEGRVPVVAGAVPMASLSDPKWILSVTHKAGSLQAVANRAWRQNLMVSGLVLLTLTGGLIFAVLAWRRSNDLRRQQLDFVSGVSHELRTPVSVICLAGANLADGVVVESGQVRQYGSLIQKEGRRLAEMTEQVLSFARIGRDVPAERSLVMAVDVLVSGLGSFKIQLDELRFVCTVRTEGDVSGAAILVDKSAVEQALQNLISNAIKYSGQAREITLRVLEKGEDGERWTGLSVEDRGIGIPLDELELVFEPFRRGRSAIASNAPGTGLGLSLVRRIVQLHGGTVEVRSAVGQGTTMTLWFPQNAAKTRSKGEG